VFNARALHDAYIKLSPPLQVKTRGHTIIFADLKSVYKVLPAIKIVKLSRGNNAF